MKKVHFSRKNTIRLVIAVIVTLSLLSVYFYIIYTNSEENLVSACKMQVIQDAEEINSYLAESVNSIKIAAYEINAMQEQHADNKEIQKYLEHQTSLYAKAIDEAYEGIYGVFDGIYLDGIGWEPAPDYAPQDRPWYREAVEAGDNIAMVTPYLDSMTNTVKMSISKLLPDNKSVVALDMSMNTIQSMIEEYAGCNNWRYVMLLNDDGYVVAHSDSEELGKNYGSDATAEGSDIAAGMDSEDEYYEVSFKDKTYMAFTGKVVDNWHVVSLMDRDKLLGPLKLIILVFVVTLISIFAVVVWVLIILQRKQKQAMELNHQIQAVSRIYASMHLFNIKEDTYYEVSNNVEEVRGALDGGMNKNAQFLVWKVMDMMADERFKKAIYDFVDFSTMNERLKGKNTITREFINYKNYRCRGRLVPVDWDENGDLETVMWMVEVTDERID